MTERKKGSDREQTEFQESEREKRRKKERMRDSGTVRYERQGDSET